MKRPMKKSMVSITIIAVIISLLSAPSAALGAEVTDPMATDWLSVAGFAPGNTYYISGAKDLAAFSMLVNAGNSGAGSFFDLTGDVSLAGESYAPIGTVLSIDTSGLGYYTLGNPFAGTFDGNGHSIYGLELNDRDGGIALFTYSTGTVKNLAVYGAVTGNFFTAGIVAFGSGTIENVTNHVSVAAEGNCVGGVLAEAVGDITIRNCHNDAEITNRGAPSERSTGRMGGIIGRVETGLAASISECSNTAAITGYQYVAGILGGCFGSVSIDSCYNSGNITAISFGKAYLGSITGKLENGTISNCFNTGNLHDAHWSAGHIRAVGGIAGCEEDHTVGTAISNCYTTGEITFRTDNITSGVYFIYMTGNISGGNVATAANAMAYENCFYLTGALTIADPSHPGYDHWSDLYKGNPLVYDTAYITGCTGQELKSADVLAALGESFRQDSGINSGYPILYWQTGGSAPTITSGIDTSVIGGSATIDATTTAAEGARVSFSVIDVENGKQIRTVIATDASGAALPVSGASGSYSFIMPRRPVTIAVTLENIIDPSAEGYAVALPAGLDAIWDLSVESSYYDVSAHTIKEGATVTIIVRKEEAAVNTSFSGITVKKANGMDLIEITELDVRTSIGSRCYAEYMFTMPASAIAITLDEVYSDFAVYVRNGGHTQKAATLTRADMEEIAIGPAFYSGWSTEIDPFIGLAESAITLSAISDAAGTAFGNGDSLIVTAADGMSLTFTYDELVGTPRAYYSDIFTAGRNAVGGTAIEPMFVLNGNIAFSEQELSSMASDTLNTYRFVFGQSADELKNGTKIVDRLPKAVVSVTIVKAPGNLCNADVNSNGTVNNFDAELVVEIYTGMWQGSSAADMLLRLAADVNGDGAVNLADVRAIWAVITD